MANKKNWLGVLTIALTFSLVLTGCPNGDDGGDKGGTVVNKLVGKWKAQSDTNDPPRVVFDFMDSGMVAWDGAVVSYSLSGTTLQLGVVSGTAAFSDNDNTLYLSNFGSGTNGTYTRISSSGNNGGQDGNSSSLKITGLPEGFPQGFQIGIIDMTGYAVAAGMGTEIKNREVTINLITEQMQPWRGTGDYGVVIVIETTNKFYCYLNGIPAASINGPATLPKLGFNSALTTVQFSKFGEVSEEQIFGK